MLLLFLVLGVVTVLSYVAELTCRRAGHFSPTVKVPGHGYTSEDRKIYNFCLFDPQPMQPEPAHFRDAARSSLFVENDILPLLNVTSFERESACTGECEGRERERETELLSDGSLVERRTLRGS